MSGALLQMAMQVRLHILSPERKPEGLAFFDEVCRDTVTDRIGEDPERLPEQRLVDPPGEGGGQPFTAARIE